MNEEIIQQAALALNRGDYSQVTLLCEQILDQDEDNAEAWFFMSVVAAAGRRVAQAIKLVDKALEYDPEHIEYLSQKARYHILLNQQSLAREAADKAFAAKPDRALILDTLGVVYSKSGAVEKARDVFSRAVELDPDNAQFRYNLASVEKFLNNVDAAKASYEKAIDLQPGFARAWWALSELQQNQLDANRLERLQKELSRTQPGSEDELYLCHAISRDPERQGNLEQAFAYLERGKQRLSDKVNYSPVQDQRLMQAAHDVFASGPLAELAHNPHPNDVADDGKAVFVLGMPRSGTSLVEQVINCHSQVRSLGELQEFARAVKLKSRTQGAPLLNEAVVSAAAQVNPTEIGTLYYQMLGERVPDEGRFIDKMPLNFLCVGFILTALPRAKVVCLQRNPMDTILSNYRQLFAPEFPGYNYHYDLADTANFYVEFHHLMAFWLELFGERIYQVNYEALIAEPEVETRALLEYLELPWEDQVLEFNANQEAVLTASTLHGRQPIHKNTIGRWHDYEDLLQPAMNVLRTRGIPFEKS